jgi:glycosyltransferase involved in cell wall biosynthesis
MIHFVVSFTNNADSTPMGQALRALGVEHSFYARALSMNYRSRLQLLLWRLPRLLIHACAAARWSFSQSSRPPRSIVVGSDLEAVVFALFRWLSRREVDIVLLGFILTRRHIRWLDALRLAYFRQVFRVADLVLCYSSLERERYAGLFPDSRAKVRFVHYGLHIWGHEQAHEFVDSALGPVLAAGRSGRDYALLTRVLARSRRELRIVCDRAAALEGCHPSANITVLTNCHGDDYVRELRAAAIVVVPLAVDDVSAGQMVLMQAMAYRKPVIITRTSTVAEYVDEDSGVMLVPMSDDAALARAITQLSDQPALARRMAERAYAAYLARFSMAAFMERVCRAAGALADRDVPAVQVG